MTLSASLCHLKHSLPVVIAFTKRVFLGFANIALALAVAVPQRENEKDGRGRIFHRLALTLRYGWTCERERKRAERVDGH